MNDTLSELKPKEDMEVTPLMIEAGEAVLEVWGPVLGTALLAREVFEAMIAVWRSTLRE